MSFMAGSLTVPLLGCGFTTVNAKQRILCWRRQLRNLLGLCYEGGLAALQQQQGLRHGWKTTRGYGLVSGRWGAGRAATHARKAAGKPGCPPASPPGCVFCGDQSPALATLHHVYAQGSQECCTCPAPENLLGYRSIVTWRNCSKHATRTSKILVPFSSRLHGAQPGDDAGSLALFVQLRAALQPPPVEAVRRLLGSNAQHAHVCAHSVSHVLLYWRPLPGMYRRPLRSWHAALQRVGSGV